MRGKRVALIASGGNIDLALFRSWVVELCTCVALRYQSSLAIADVHTMLRAGRRECR